MTPVLVPDEASYHHLLTGVMRWVVKIGCIDFNTKVLLLSSYLAMPRHGHLEAMLHIMDYFKLNNNSKVAFDPFYHKNQVEAIPPNDPPPKGKEVGLCMFIDKWSRRSRTGFMIYMNMALVYLYSEKQSNIETSVFGADFVAIKVGVDTFDAIIYKLRMMCILISRPTYTYADNMSVIHNTSKPESILAYHAICESVAMGK